jgi:hypothetical protein
VKKAGRRQASTYIASGNVVFDSDKSAPAVKPLTAGLLRGRFGLTKNHAVIRTPSDAEGIARSRLTPGLPRQGGAGPRYRPHLERHQQTAGHGARALEAQTGSDLPPAGRRQRPASTA